MVFFSVLGFSFFKVLLLVFSTSALDWVHLFDQTLSIFKLIRCGMFSFLVLQLEGTLFLLGLCLESIMMFGNFESIYLIVLL